MLGMYMTHAVLADGAGEGAPEQVGEIFMFCFSLCVFIHSSTSLFKFFARLTVGKNCII